MFFLFVFLTVYIVYLTVCVFVSALATKERKGRGGFFSGGGSWGGGGGFSCFLREQHDDTALCPTDDDWAFSPDSELPSLGSTGQRGTHFTPPFASPRES